jgi:SAM-dependent methyltransferase
MRSGAYEFGKNWRSYVEHHLDDARLAEAGRSLSTFLKVDSLAGRSFLDVGCGSGLFSLAAHHLGAAPVVSVDVDADSVGCTLKLRSSAGNPESWKVLQGSILDKEFTRGLGEFDIVYSWGVLHHTGDMWNAIASAAARVRPEGLLYIAIYNRADGIGLYSDGRLGSSRTWERAKRLYNRLPSWTRPVVDYSAAAGMIAAYIATGKNPVTQIKQHKGLRGMSWMVDIRDWLGGYPYEYASVGEVFGFVHERFGYTLENLTSTNSLRCNEYLFRRSATSSSSSVARLR